MKYEEMDDIINAMCFIPHSDLHFLPLILNPEDKFKYSVSPLDQ